MFNLLPGLNSFVESVLRLKSYPAKVTLLFGLIASLSLAFAFFIDILISIKETEQTVNRAAKKAASFRIEAIRNQLRAIYRHDVNLINLIEEGKLRLSDTTIYSSTILCAGLLKGKQPTEHYGVYPLENIKDALTGVNIKDYYIHIEPHTLIVVNFIEASDKIYYFCHEGSELAIILSKRLGAISKYGAEFYFGKKPDVKEGDILVSVPTPKLSAKIYVHVPKGQVIQAFVTDRLFLYARLFILIWITYILGYVIFSNILMYPVRRLQEISKKLLRGEWELDFGEFRTAQDEFGDIGRTLEELSRKELTYRERVNAVFKVVMRGARDTGELPEFAQFVVDTLYDVFKAKKVFLLLKDMSTGSVELKIKTKDSDEYLEKEVVSLLEQFLSEIDGESSLSRHIDYSTLEVFISEIGSFHKLAIGLLVDKPFNSEDKNYVRIILKNMVYILNLLHMASTDLLTSLPNRRSFDYDLEKYKTVALRYKRPLSLMMIDIDNFKSINDVYGHQAGDLVLRKVAKVIKSAVRDSDTVYRYGGEEFVVLLPETTKEGAVRVAEKILESVRKESFWVGEETSLYITVSIGVANFPEDTIFPEQLVAIADVALYKAKGRGKDRVESIQKDEYENIYIKSFKEERELLKVIKEGKVVPFFQPIVDIRNKSVFGFEVLSRLVKPDGSIVPAAKFVERARKSGLLEQIDARIYAGAKEFFGCKNHEVSFFLNTSPSSIESKEVVDTLEQIPEKHRHRFYIEITEAEAFRDMETALSVIKTLRNMGFKIALDDFGAGFSSMLYLKYLIGNVDLIKVDGHFIRNMAHDKNNRVFLRSIKLISYAFNVPLLGEWVETEEDFKLVKSLGFRYAQGYYFGKPTSDCCEAFELKSEVFS